MADNIVNKIKKETFAKALNNADNSIFNKLDDKNIYEINKIDKKLGGKIYYYFINCQIINKEIYDLLYKIDKTFNIKSKYKSIECLFSYGKAIVFNEKKSLHIGLIDNNNIYIPEFLIYSNKFRINSQILPNIFDFIKKNGYELFEELINENQIILEDSNIEANIDFFEDKEQNEIKNIKPY